MELENMNLTSLFVVTETGGSIAENAKYGYERVVGDRVFTDKNKAKEFCKRMSKFCSGGYYGYHFKTKTLKSAMRVCEKLNLASLKIEE